MAVADQLFHNKYLLEDIFSYVKCGDRYCDLWEGDVAARGQLKLLQLIAANKNYFDSRKAMSWAVMRGHLHVIQWLHTNRSEGCNIDAMDLAAGYGQLHVVKWLHNNCAHRFTASAIAWALAGSHPEIAEWLQENAGIAESRA